MIRISKFDLLNDPNPDVTITHRVIAILQREWLFTFACFRFWNSNILRRTVQFHLILYITPVSLLIHPRWIPGLQKWYHRLAAYSAVMLLCCQPYRSSRCHTLQNRVFARHICCGNIRRCFTYPDPLRPAWVHFVQYAAANPKIPVRKKLAHI